MSEPKISVIIPMYNAEKFIRQCLISMLASKFKDYDVLVVDDCSTDNSVAEVEKLTPHFDGRLKILSTEKNSGGSGIPRNIGIKNAAGKYVTFVDADDMILPTALGDFFDVAEKFQADVVHTEKFLEFNNTDKGNFRWKDLTLQKYETGSCVEAPEFEPANLKERVNRCIEGKFLWMPWGKFYRRDFLTGNKIEFSDVPFTSDLFFGFKSFCLADKYLRVPYVTNIYRLSQSSMSKRITSSASGVRLWLKVLLKNISDIDELASGLEFFKASPDYQFAVVKFFIDKHFDMIENLFQGLNPHEVQKIFYDELQNPELDSKGKNLVAAYLYAERALTR